MRRAALMFVVVLLPGLAQAQGGSWTYSIDLPRTAQLEPVTPSTEFVRSSLFEWLQRTDGRYQRSRFALWRSEWVEQSEKREPQPGSPRRNWIGRHPALFGALVGAGVGAVSALTLENELVCSGGDEDCVFYGGSRALIGAGVGGGVGALVGWIAGLANK